MTCAVERQFFLGMGKLGQALIADLLKNCKRSLNSIDKLEGKRIPDLFPIRVMTIVNPEEFTAIKNSTDDYLNELSVISPEDEFYESLQDLTDASALKNIRDIIIKLNNLKSDNISEYFESTLSLAITPPRLFVLCDINEITDELSQFVENLKNIDDGRITKKYTMACLVYCPRLSRNSDKLKFLSAIFDSVFLIGDDLESLVFESRKDVKDLILNFLLVLSFSGYSIGNKENYEERFYSIGTSAIYFPGSHIVVETLFKKLGYNNEEAAIEFKKSFCGEFYKVKAGMPEDPFSLGEYEDNTIINIEEVSDEYFPEVNEKVCNKAYQIEKEFFTWVDDHIERMKSEFKKESLILRLKDLTKVSTFIKVAVELWQNNIDAINFIFDYEIVNRAKYKSTLLLNDFTNRFDKQLDNLQKEIFKPFLVHEREAINNGILGWCTGKDIIREIIDCRIKKISEEIFNKNNNIDHSDLLKDILNKVKILPRPITIISRSLIFLTILLAFSVPVNRLIFNTTSVITAILSSATLFIIFILSLYWFGYRWKVRDLYSLLQKYLVYRRTDYEKRISIIESGMIKEFLIGIAGKVKKTLGTRHGYFYTLLNHEFNYQNDLKEDTIFLLDSPSSTERFFINRFVLHQYLSSKLNSLYKRHVNSVSSVINEGVIQKFDSKFEEISEHLYTKAKIESIISNYERKEYENGLHLIEKFYNDTQIYLVPSIDILLKTGMSEIQSIIQQDERNLNLVNYIESSYPIDEKLYSQVLRKTRLTFLWNDNNDSDGTMNVFGNNIRLFSNELSEKVNEKFYTIPDKNNIILVTLNGPKIFNDISWK